LSLAQLAHVNIIKN